MVRVEEWLCEEWLCEEWLYAGCVWKEVLVSSGLAKSNREVREFISGGAVRVNGEQVKENRALEAGDLLHDRFTLLKRGKKLWRAINWT